MIEYTTDKIPTADELAALFRSSEMKRPVDDPDRLERMLKGAQLVLCAWNEGRLVGIARSVTDFSYCCYLSDLAVDSDFQKRGIGSELIRQTKEAIGDECVLILLSAPGAMDYYPKVGFTKADNAWFVARKK